MDDGEHEPGGRGRGEQRARRPRRGCDRQRQCGWDEELPRSRRRQPERGVGAAAVRRERRDPDLREDDRDRRPHAAEERPPRLVRHEQRQRREHRRLVEDDVCRIDEGDASDERQEAVPERERITGVETAVGELVHRVERERAEGVELAHARKVEEPVAADLAGNRPEQEAEDGARAEDPPAARNPLGSRRATAGGERDDSDRDQQPDRQRQRAADEKGDRERAEDGSKRPGERRRGRAQPERASDREAGSQHERGREREPQQRHRRSSSGTEPEPSQAAPSRYILPRSPRKSAPRRSSDARSSLRAHSAWPWPRCLAKKRRCPRRFSR